MASATAPEGMGPLDQPSGGTLTTRLATGAWGLALSAGIIAIVIGIVVIAWPQATVGVVAILFGIQLLVQGAIRIIQGCAATEESLWLRGLYVLFGIACLAVGFLALGHLMKTAGVLAVLFGLSLFIGGSIECVRLLTHRHGSGHGVALTIAILSMVAGLAVLADPRMSLTLLIWVLGLWLITWGCLTVFITLAIRHMNKRVAAVE